MKLLLTLFSILPLTSFCQDDLIKTRKVKLGITYSADLCYRTLKSDGSANGQYIKEMRYAEEITVYGYTTGLSLLLRADKKLVIETGIQYSRKGEQTEKIDLSWSSSNLESPTKRSYIYQYHYLDIPLKANYFFPTRKKSNFFASGGLSANIFLRHKNIKIFEYSDGRKDPQESTYYEGFSKVNIAAMISIGMNYSIAERISIRIEPIFRHSITPIADTPIKEYPWSAGVNTGVYFSF